MIENYKRIFLSLNYTLLEKVPSTFFFYHSTYFLIAISWNFYIFLVLCAGEVVRAEATRPLGRIVIIQTRLEKLQSYNRSRNFHPDCMKLFDVTGTFFLPTCNFQLPTKYVHVPRQLFSRIYGFKVFLCFSFGCLWAQMLRVFV